MTRLGCSVTTFVIGRVEENAEECDIINAITKRSLTSVLDRDFFCLFLYHSLPLVEEAIVFLAVLMHQIKWLGT